MLTILEINSSQIAIDFKTLRGIKDDEGKAEHVLSAFCAALEQSVGHTSSCDKGRKIPDALRLLETIDLEGLVVTGDAIFYQKSITSRIVEKNGDYLFPVMDNQKDLREEIETAFREPVFPLTEWQDPPRTGHGRIELRQTDLLPRRSLSTCAAYGRQFVLCAHHSQAGACSGRKHCQNRNGNGVSYNQPAAAKPETYPEFKPWSLADRDYAP